MFLTTLNLVESPGKWPVCPVEWRGGTARCPPIPISATKQTIGSRTPPQGRTAGGGTWTRTYGLPIAGRCFPRPAARLGASATVSCEAAATKEIVTNRIRVVACAGCFRRWDLAASRPPPTISAMAPRIGLSASRTTAPRNAGISDCRLLLRATGSRWWKNLPA